jgi:hypothetical protein
MTPAELRRIGKRLYADHWQIKLAQALPVSTRSIHHWLSGSRKMRKVIAERIRSLTPERLK